MNPHQQILQGIFIFYDAKCAVLQSKFESWETFPSSIETHRGGHDPHMLLFIVLYVMYPHTPVQCVCTLLNFGCTYCIYQCCLELEKITDCACGLFWFQGLFLSLHVEQRDQLSVWFCHFFCSGIHVTKTGCWHQQCGRIWYESNTILNDFVIVTV